MSNKTNIDIYMSELEVSKRDIKGAIQSKGVTPSGGLSSYAEAILSIPTSSIMGPLEETITENGEYVFNPIDNGVEGYNQVNINVDIEIPEIPTFETQAKTVEIKRNGTQTITPDSGYDGLSKVEVTVNVASTAGKTPIPNGFRFTGGDISQVDFSQYDWSMVYDTSEFFSGCSHSTGDWSNFVENFNGNMLSAEYMFGNQKNADSNKGVSVLPNLGSLTSNLKSTSYMCYNQRPLKDASAVNLWDTHNVTDASYMFTGNTISSAYQPQITTIDLSNFGHPDGYKANNMFNRCDSLISVKGLRLKGESNSVFEKCSKLTTLEDIDTSKVTNMSYMFRGCSALTTIPQLDTSKVTNMSSMFSGCSKLTTIPQLDTSNVTSMTSMFYGCSALTSIPHLDTSSVTSMAIMFYGCSALTSIPHLDTSKVTNMDNMFNGCSALTSIPHLDTSSVTSMGEMFSGCSKLTTIPQLDLSGVTSLNRMLTYCSSLTTIPDLNISKSTNFGGTSTSHSWLINSENVESIGVLDCDSISNVTGAFGSSTNNKLTHVGGFRNLGKASFVSNTNSTSFMTYAPNLTYESVMNVINLLYDRKANGLSTLTLKLHANHMALLSADDIAIATNKGWSLTS